MVDQPPSFSNVIFDLFSFSLWRFRLPNGDDFIQGIVGPVDYRIAMPIGD